METKKVKIIENFTDIKNEDSRFIAKLSIPLPANLIPKDLNEVYKFLKFELNKIKKKSLKINKNDLLLIVSLISVKIHINDIKNFSLAKILIDLWIKTKNIDNFKKQISIIKLNKDKLKLMIDNNMPEDIIKEINNGLEKYKVNKLFDKESNIFYEIPLDVLEIILSCTNYINIQNEIKEVQISTSKDSKTKEKIETPEEKKRRRLKVFCFFGILILLYLFYKYSKKN